MIGSSATSSPVFKESGREFDSSFRGTLAKLTHRPSSYRTVSGSTRTKVLAPDSNIAQDSPAACRNLPSFLIKFENILSDASYPVLKAKASDD